MSATRSRASTALCEPEAPPAVEVTDDLAPRIAHAIQTPLAALLGTAQMCAEEPGADPHWERIIHLARRIGGTVESMLELGRHQSLECKPTSAVALFDRVQDELRDRCVKADVSLTASVTPDVGIFPADTRLLMAALVSAAENAVEALEATGGEITLEALRVVRPSEGDEISLRISDDGPGIPLELRDSVLHPFVSSKRRGAGFGLAIARDVAQSHGGRIALTESPAGGTLVELRIPADH